MTADAVLATVGYRDRFVAPIIRADQRGLAAEAWARRFLEEAPPRWRRSLLLIWRGVLGARLGPLGAADHVFGWRIVESTPARIVLEMYSALGARAHLTIRTAGGEVSVLTEAEFLRALPRRLFPAIVPVHRYAVAHLLEHATGAPARADS